MTYVKFQIVQWSKQDKKKTIMSMYNPASSNEIVWLDISNYSMKCSTFVTDEYRLLDMHMHAFGHGYLTTEVIVVSFMNKMTF